MIKTNIPKVLKVEMIWILWYKSALTADTLNLFLLLFEEDYDINEDSDGVAEPICKKRKKL